MPHPISATVPVVPADFRKLAVTLVGAMLLALGATAWSSKADKADVEALRYDVQRVLDLLCADKPAARQCKQ